MRPRKTIRRMVCRKVIPLQSVCQWQRVVKLGDELAAADEECGDADGQQTQSRRFRHGLEGQYNRSSQPGGKGALRSARREFIDVAAASVCLKQIARTVKGQSIGLIQPGGKGD